MKLAAQKFFVRVTFGTPTWESRSCHPKGIDGRFHRGEVEG
jgi:hypothetical protein